MRGRKGKFQAKNRRVGPSRVTNVLKFRGRLEHRYFFVTLIRHMETLIMGVYYHQWSLAKDAETVETTKLGDLSRDILTPIRVTTIIYRRLGPCK